MIVQKILTLGISPFLILATDSVIIIVLNSVLQKFGGPSEGDILITCATIVQSFMMLITGPMLGISSGTQAILSYNYGAKEIKRVKKAEKYILILCLCFTTLMFVLSVLYLSISSTFSQKTLYSLSSVHGELEYLL